MVVCLIIFDCPSRLVVVGEELRWRGGVRVCSTWLSSRCSLMARAHSDLMTNNALGSTKHNDHPNPPCSRWSPECWVRSGAGWGWGWGWWPLSTTWSPSTNQLLSLFHFKVIWVFSLSGQCSDHRSIRTWNVSSICSAGIFFEMQMEKALVILLSQWFCKMSHLEYRSKSSYFAI